MKVENSGYEFRVRIFCFDQFGFQFFFRVCFAVFFPSPVSFFFLVRLANGQLARVESFGERG